MRRRIRFAGGLMAALVLFGLLAAMPALAATTVDVRPGSLNGWTLVDYTDQCTGSPSTATIGFVGGPKTPPLGVGSLRYTIGSNGDSYVQARNPNYNGTKLSALTTLQYSTYVSQYVDGQAPYLVLNISTTGNGTADDALFFEPVYQNGSYGMVAGNGPIPNQGNVTLNTWQTWNALAGGWWLSSDNAGGPPLRTIAAFAAANPSATIVNTSAGGGLSVRAGCGAGAWDNFVGNTDKVVVGVGGSDTTFNFDTTIINVRPSSLNGWAFGDDGHSVAGTGSFVYGPGTPPIGSGSARITIPASTSAGEVLYTTAYGGTRLDQITSLNYSTYRTSGDPATALALQLNVDYNLNDANTAWQGRLVYEPYVNGTVTTGIWQTWDALAGKWWASGAPGSALCPQSTPCTWAQVLAAFPNAGIHTVYSGIDFKAGSGWGTGFDGNVDNFTIATTTAAVTYNFDPDLAAPAVTSVTAAPNPATYGDMAFTFGATVVGTGGGPTPTGNVNFYVVPTGTVNYAPGYVGTAPLNGSGVATLPYTYGSPPNAGSYRVVAEYAGDSYYGTTTGETTLVVNRAPTSLTNVSATGTYGGAITFTGTLRDTYNNVTLGPGYAVEFHAGPGAGTFVCSAQTDASGVATCTGTLPSGQYPNVGTYANYAHAYFYGAQNTTNYQSSQGHGPLTLGKATLWLKPVDQTVTKAEINTPAKFAARLPAGNTCPIEVVGVPGTGLANGDTLTGGAVNTTYLRCTYGASSASVPGTYPIVATGVTSTNYLIKWQTGKLTIKP